MGNPVIWLSGANPQLLAELPTERPKYIGIGSAILITGTIASVSMAFALHTALGAPLALAIPLAAAWGLAIMSLDRWLVVSLQREENKWNYLRLAIPRVLLAFLFGVIISTPVVLQIFGPEINAKIPAVQRQDTAYNYDQASHDAISVQITRYQGQISHWNSVINNAGQIIKNISQDPQVKFLRRQRNKESRHLGADLAMWQNGANATIRAIGARKYQTDNRLRAGYITKINQRETQISTNETNLVTRSQKQLGQAQTELQAAQQRQTAFLGELRSQAKKDTGLLIRLQALDELAARSSTIRRASLILFLFFTVIECLPIIVKILLNLGPPNAYEKAHAAAEETQLQAVEERIVRAKYAAFTEAEQITLEAQRMIDAWRDTDPAIDREAVDAANRVARARLNEWEKRAMRELAGVSERSAEGSPAGPKSRPSTVAAGTGSTRFSPSNLVAATRNQLRWLFLRGHASPTFNTSPYGGHFSPNGSFARRKR